MRILLPVLPLLVACSSTPTRTTETPPDACDGYPEGAIQPMEAGQVLYPYSWPEARNLWDGRILPLDLGQVPCASDPDIDWSPFDVLLFVSIPAW